MTAITSKAWDTNGQGNALQGARPDGIVARGAQRLLWSLRVLGRASTGMSLSRSIPGQLGERRETSLGRHLGARI